MIAEAFEVSGPTGLSDEDRQTMIHELAVKSARNRIKALGEDRYDELIDLESAVPEEWSVDGSLGVIIGEDHTTRPATEAECRQFHVSLPPIAFDVCGDIRRQVAERLTDLAAECLRIAIALRGPFEPLDDEGDSDEAEASQVEAGSAPF